MSSLMCGRVFNKIISVFLQKSLIKSNKIFIEISNSSTITTKIKTNLGTLERITKVILANLICSFYFLSASVL